MRQLSILFLIAVAEIRLSAQPPNQVQPIRLAFSGKAWAVKIDAPGFVVEQNLVRPDGRAYLLAKRGSYGLSIMLQKVTGAAHLDDCKKTLRARSQPNGPLKPTDVQLSEVGEMAVLEYMLAEVGGLPVKQMNIFGCLAKEDTYIDIHLSKVKFIPDEHASLTALLSSARIVAPLSR